MICMRRLRGSIALFTLPVCPMKRGVSHSPPHGSHSHPIPHRHPSRARRTPSPQHSDPHVQPFLGRMEFEVVWPLQMDTNAAARVEHYLRQEQKTRSDAFPRIRVVNVPKSTLKRALMRFDVQGREVTAIGQSTRAKLAQTLCCMHAARLIDHHSTEKHSDEKHSDKQNSDGPLPLAEAPAPRRGPTRPRGADVRRRFDPPQPTAYSDWSTYVEDCAAYISAAARAAQEEAYAQLQVPRQFHPLVDRAAALTERIRTTDPMALQRLNNKSRGGGGGGGTGVAAGAAIRVGRAGPRVFVATLALDAAARFAAIGVAATAKDAKRRCAMHALAVLQLARSHDDNNNNNNNHNSGSRGNGGSCVSPDAMAASLSPRRARQFAFLLRLCDVKPLVSFERAAHRVVCRVELCGAAVRAEGATRFEAERRAVEEALAALEIASDPRLQAINGVMARHPAVSPAHMPSAMLPAQLRAAIHDAVLAAEAAAGSNAPQDSIAAQSPAQGLVQSPAQSSAKGLVQSPAQGLVQGSAQGLVQGSAQSSAQSPAQGLVQGSAQGLVQGSAPVAAPVDRETMAAVAAMESAAAAPNPLYAARMRERLIGLRADPSYLSRYHSRRSALAITGVAQRILDALEHHRVVVVSGTTGCGKTTQVPQFILDEEIMAGRGDRCCIVVTQPRRLSAFSVAERIANERLSAVGEEIGYAVRLDARPGKHVTLCTTGVLLQMLAGMPTLAAVTHLIIDEVHERDVNCDVVLALVRQLIAGPNKHLKVVLMSATMQSDTFAAYFGGVPVIAVEGAVYPVAVRYMDDIAKLMRARGQCSPMFDVLKPKPTASSRRHNHNHRNDITRPPKTDYALLAQLVEHSVAVDMRGDAAGKSVLVFLPGWKEMQAARRAIEAISGGAQRYHIILLHSTVDAAKQRECFAPPPSGHVKIVLATNIAESGITIDDAAVVIDTGLIKQTTWILGDSNSGSGSDSQCPATFATQLALTFASRANCTQRKGRAGRTQGGVCYRLFTRDVWDALPAFQRAEIHRTPLTQVLLKLLSLGHSRPRETLQTFMEPPAERHVSVSMRQLQSLGAVTADEQLTPLGIYLSRLPCEPHVGKMLMMGAVLNCLDSALTMVATGSISPFVASREVAFEVRERRYALAMGSESDHISAINAYNAYSARCGDENFAHENYLNVSNMRLISRYKQQYCDILRRSGFLRAGETLRRVTNDSSASNYISNDAFGDDDDVLCMDTNNKNDLYVDAGPLSRDATDVALVKACLCSALFPNVTVVDPESMLQAKPTKRLVMRTITRRSISPAKDSACRRLRRPITRNPSNTAALLEDMDLPAVTPSMLYMYESVFSMKETREEFLTHVSSVSLWALLLFGVTEADTTFDRQLGLCVAGGWIGIHIDAESFDALQALRAGLHACVLRKYMRPTDEANNKALEELRHLCKAVLKSPPNDGEQYINRLVDAGRILSPVVAEPLTGDSSDNNNNDNNDNNDDDDDGV